MKGIALLACSLVLPAAHAQWQILDSHTKADLRGIDATGDGVAWASGAKGTVLRTLDDGRTWYPCVVPEDAANLDFTNVQGIDDLRAVVMSTGKGSGSRIYRTADGCHTWKRVFDNPNPTSSFVSLHRYSALQLYLLGDPVHGKLVMFTSNDAGSTWSVFNEPGLELPRGAGDSAAGTASVTNVDWLMAFGTAGHDAAVYTFDVDCKTRCKLTWTGKTTPLAQGSPTAGVYSVSGRTYVGEASPSFTGDATLLTTTLIAVGGDSARPADRSASAAVSKDGGATWRPSGLPPGGYRSAVDLDPSNGHFIAVGPNGTDVSTDDGVSWLPLKPGPGDTPGADEHWNSLSFPFVVGPNGRIGILRTARNTTLAQSR